MKIITNRSFVLIFDHKICHGQNRSGRRNCVNVFEKLERVRWNHTCLYIPK